MLVKIAKVLPLVSRQYQTREGRTELFKTKGFIMENGQSTIYAEALQQTADYLESLGLVEGNVGNAVFTFRSRSFTSKEGKEVYTTEVTLAAFMPI